MRKQTCWDWCYLEPNVLNLTKGGFEVQKLLSERVYTQVTTATFIGFRFPWSPKLTSWDRLRAKTHKRLCSQKDMNWLGFCHRWFHKPFLVRHFLSQRTSRVDIVSPFSAEINATLFLKDIIPPMWCLNLELGKHWNMNSWILSGQQLRNRTPWELGIQVRIARTTCKWLWLY